MADRELTPKQKAFVAEYLVDLNATQAASRAGYSDGNYGRQLLTNPNVEAALAKAFSARQQRTEITADRVLQELALIAFANHGDYFDWDEERACYIPKRDLTREQMAAISAMESEQEVLFEGRGADREPVGSVRKLKIRMHDKLAALREIGKHLGIAERHELSGPNGGPIEHSVTETREKVARRLDAIGGRIAALAPSANGNGKHG